MLRRLLSSCAVAAAACSFTLPGTAGPSPAGTPVEPGQVRAWLMRIHDAASHRNFQGTFVVSSAGSVSSSRIAHYCVGPNQYERIESLDGPARHVFRHNEVVHTLWPKSRVVLVEQRDLVAAFPALLQAGGDRINDFYEVRALAPERMAGREADVMLLKPKDNLRYGYRLWADRETGLLLRVEVLGEHGEVVESSAFSELTVGVRAQPDSVLAPMHKLEGYRVLKPTLTPARLDAEGWGLRENVAGFEQVRCVKRPLGGMAVDDRDATTSVLQTIYSDGLTYVSIFIEPYDAARHTRDMHTVVGSTQTLMRRQGGWWVTLVGDVPAGTLRQFASRLEYRK